MAPGLTPPRVTTQRFFLPASCFQDRDVHFPPGASQQIRRVLRLHEGDTVVALDGSGLECMVRLDEVSRQVQGTIVERRCNRAESRARLTLYQGFVKGNKFELILQKCTETGVAGFVPVSTARAVPNDINPARHARFETIVREAAEQSGRGLLPTIDQPVPLATAMQQAAASGPIVFLWEDETTVHMRDLRLSGAPAVSLFVGPEGGFTADEASAARRVGANVVTLGSRVLRAETAAIVGAALVLANTGDLG
ncbi:MAG: 16S rRNA (uracil(1498)-N(3))-methyltransferase [Chloroflexota bacterium]